MSDICESMTIFPVFLSNKSMMFKKDDHNYLDNYLELLYFVTSTIIWLKKIYIIYYKWLGLNK